MSLREFPHEHEAKKKPIFYPEEALDFDGDILEIGPGNGDFLISLAKNFPAKKIVAVEIRSKRFQKIRLRLQKEKLPNILLMWGDARVILPRHFSEKTFEKIYVLYPDPWPKQRHAFHRLLDFKFLSLLALCLKKNGELIVATDSKEYADGILNHVVRIPSLKAIPLKDKFQETFFERVWKKEGKKIFYLSYFLEAISFSEK